jgi:hypothetical protein
MIRGTWIAGWFVAEPVRQVDVGDRAALGADALRDLRQRAWEPVRGEDQALAGDHSCGDCDTAIRPAF